MLSSTKFSYKEATYMNVMDSLEYERDKPESQDYCSKHQTLLAYPRSAKSTPPYTMVKSHLALYGPSPYGGTDMQAIILAGRYHSRLYGHAQMQLRSLRILVILDRPPKAVDIVCRISSGVTMHIEKAEDILISVIMQFMPR